MSKLLQERLRFRLLRAVLFVSNVTSLIINVLILIFGLDFIKAFIRVPDATDPTVRTFAIIECCLCTIAIIGIIMRNFYTFTVYTVLLIVYLVCAAIFTRVPVGWFFLLGFILVSLAVLFDYLLWLNRKQLKQMKRENPYKI
ncbi:uncharacterized protein LOC124499430 [Dermatophagoides farinae]|uniref:Uncharacterized protein n=1 Tax=Dermatophagoides farinae TaxID=6954 RepID=A0A922L2A7_DERFA|nr:uncharacterized protein LOC124499430 [Dermatophagoides farinae]KAH7644650.1 hypothetical protein HUG17_0188 [Dermatophagoides farinae]KAH9511747.1 hypothetical protein DERF_010179 [Dermatophagoides farinae]